LGLFGLKELQRKFVGIAKWRNGSKKRAFGTKEMLIPFLRNRRADAHFTGKKNPVKLHVFFSCVVARGKAHVKRESEMSLSEDTRNLATVLPLW
jgi:hypothetical protein